MPKRTATEITYGFSNQYDMQSLNVYIFLFCDCNFKHFGAHNIPSGGYFQELSNVYYKPPNS